jgi:hypothetical protein
VVASLHVGSHRPAEQALAEVQRNAFAAGGVGEITLDFDSTYIFSRSKRRQGVDRTYKKGYALHPLLCFDAESGAAVHARLRRGKAGASTGMKTFLTETLRRVPAGVAVRARLDSGFHSNPLLTQMEQAQVTYLCGVPLIPAILGTCAQIPDECWDLCLDKDEGEVAEFGYRMRDRRQFRRYIVNASRSRSASRPPSRAAAFATGSSSPTTTTVLQPGSSPSIATKPTSSPACANSNRTSVSAPSASTASWPTGRGCCSCASPTTCAVGPAPRPPPRWTR